MLQNMRDNSRGLMSGILIGFLVFLFALSGAESLFNRDPIEQSAVKVNGEKLTRLDVERAIANRRQQMQARFGDSVPPEFLTEEHLRGPAIESLVERALLVQAATRLGLVAQEEKLNQEILATPAFHNDSGVFDARRYQMLLSNLRYTPSTYKKAIGEDAVINQLSSGIVDTSFVTPAEVALILELNFQTRDFDYLLLDADKVADQVVIDERQIEAYYAANQNNFIHPEEIAVDYIELSVDSLMANLEVTEDALQQRYQQNIANFIAAPEFQVAHILIESSDKKTIAEISEKLAAGTSFDDLAKEYSDDLGSRDTGGDLGFTSGDTFPEPFEAALASLSIGQVSEPVKTEAGTHFIKKLSERGVDVPSFEEERDRLVEQLKREQAEYTFAGLLGRLRDLSYNAEQLGEVAKELGLDVTNTGLFGRSGGTGIAAQRLFIDAAFSADVLEDSNASDVIELGSNRVFVLKKTEYRESYLRPLDDVREDILASLTQTRTQELLAQKATQIKEEISADSDLAALAANHGLTLESVQTVNRNAPTVDRQLLAHAFTMNAPAEGKVVVDSLPLFQGDYAIVVLRAVNTDTSNVPAEQKQVIASQLSNIAGQNEFRRFQAHLHNAAKIDR